MIVDEAARVSGELYHSATPALAKTGGRIIALSTPWGRRGWFHDAWFSDEPWDRYKVTANDLPEDWYKPDKATFLAAERRRKGERWYRQEFMCEFEEPEGSVFRAEDVARIQSGEITPLFEDADNDDDDFFGEVV